MSATIATISKENTILSLTTGLENQLMVQRVQMPELSKHSYLVTIDHADNEIVSHAKKLILGQLSNAVSFKAMEAEEDNKIWIYWNRSGLLPQYYIQSMKRVVCGVWDAYTAFE